MFKRPKQDLLTFALQSATTDKFIIPLRAVLAFALEAKRTKRGVKVAWKPGMKRPARRKDKIKMGKLARSLANMGW